MKLIDADKLIAEIERRKKEMIDKGDQTGYHDAEIIRRSTISTCNDLLFFIASLQQDKETLELCSQVWWEDRGWIMIPPNVTLEGIDVLLKQVKKKLQQEKQDGDLEKDVKSYIKDNFTITDEVAQIPEEDRMCSMGQDDMVAFAKHFYELGKANEEE